MKKSLLLVALALASIDAFAQSTQSVPYTNKAKKAVLPVKLKPGHAPNWGKSTAGGSRWYSHAEIVNELLGGTSSTFNWELVPIWFDSTVLQNFTTGLAPIEYTSFAQVLDPIYFDLNNDPALFPSSTIVISPYDAYSVDSISFTGAYVDNDFRPVNIVDTLIFSVSPTSSTTNSFPYYFENCTGSLWTVPPGQYIPCSGADTQVRGFSIFDIDTANRASAVPGKLVWKVPLYQADRQLADSAGWIFPQSYTFPVMSGNVPASVNIPAGKGVVITVTFKSGDVVAIPNVDTFTDYHHFYLLSGEAQGTGTQMLNYYYSNNDRNMSNLMFSTAIGIYAPTLFIEGITGPDFQPEFHELSAHIVCNTCATSVGNVQSALIDKTSAYPNPATDEVNISFTTRENTTATVTITNAIGQIVASQSAGNVSANVENKLTFPTSGLPAGIYLYTVEANGERSAGRFVVTR